MKNLMLKIVARRAKIEDEENDIFEMLEEKDFLNSDKIPNAKFLNRVKDAFEEETKFYDLMLKDAYILMDPLQRKNYMLNTMNKIMHAKQYIDRR